MPNKLTNEDLDRMFEEALNAPRQPPPKLSQEAQKKVDEAFDEIARIMGFDREERVEPTSTFKKPTLTSKEIELGLLTDVLEGERRDEWFANPPENCDSCQVELLKRRYFVDGKLKGSIGWANLCAECFFENGEGIGWGAGQVYLQWKLGEWLLVGGFQPE